jgi:hypothetical protein
LATGERDADTLAEAGRAVILAERAVQAAEEELAAARGHQVSPAPDQPDPVTVAERALRHAQEDLQAARTELADLHRRIGPVLPASEVVFLPTFPARIETLKAEVGTEVKAPLATLSSGAVKVRADLNPFHRGLLKPGMKVEIASELLGVTASGSIESIGDLEQDASGNRSHLMVVSPATELNPKLAGQDVRITVEAAATVNEVLVVPLAAIYTGADGQTAVTRRDNDGTRERIPVKLGLVGDGYVEATPLSNVLQPGDRVIVGVQPPTAKRG